MFEPEGYAVDTAFDGQSGLETFRAAQPSAVVLDLRLPGMPGRDVCREIKTTAPAVPVIVLSAQAMTNDRDLALAAGGDDFDTKPVQFQRLIEKIEALLAKRVRR